jgi:flagellar basal body rod protein FlgB
MGGLFSTPGQLALEARLAALIAQRAVLADAVANVDTPGYQPAAQSGFAPALEAAVAAQLGLGAGTLQTGQGGGPAAPAAAAPSAAGGFRSLAAQSAFPGASPPPASPSAVGAGVLPPVPVPTPGAVTPDGNGVGLDATMAELATNDLDYQAVLRQLQLIYQNISDAIDVGGA